MKEFILSTEIIEENLKEQITELFEAPEETKMRIQYILKQFYSKGYKPFEQQIVEKSMNAKHQYINLLEENPKLFLEVNFKKASLNGSTSFKYDRYDVYVSYMQQFGYTIFANNQLENPNGTISIGAKNIDLFKTRNISVNFEKFLKIIADRTRFKIITYVSKDSWYVHALAKELDLSPATIHYHLETLHSLDIVSSIKDGNKVMYTLNEEVTKQYVDFLQKQIFQK